MAWSGEHVLSWHLARSETSRVHAKFLRGIAPPEMVVTDGGPEFVKVAREVWPGTRVQRCLFHVFCQVRRYTTSMPKLLEGAEPLPLVKDLLHVEASVRQSSGRRDSWAGASPEKFSSRRG